MDLNIFEKEHFKTLIRFKDYLQFENLLSQNRIPFFAEEISNTNISNYCRYYFLQENREQINLILKENAIMKIMAFLICNNPKRFIKSMEWFYCQFF